MLHDACPALAEDAPPPPTSSDHHVAIRGVIVIREILAPPRLTRDQISELKGRKYHHLRNVPMTTSDAEARVLIAKYGKLVWKIVSERKLSIPRQAIGLASMDDLYAIGCAMMIQSVEMFDATREAKLSTWIAIRVRQGITSVVTELHGSTSDGGGRTARGEELAHARGEQARKVHVDSLSLHICGGVDGYREMVLGDFIASEDEPPDERLESCQEREWLIRTIDRVCSGRERDVLYRVLAGEPYQSIADRHEVARQRVEQIYAKAVQKLARHRQIEDVKRERALRAPSA